VLLAGSASAEDLIRLNTFRPPARCRSLSVSKRASLLSRASSWSSNSPRVQIQREGLANGKFEVVHSAVDNALAMIELAKVDVVIVSGGDGGTNEFIIGKGLNSYADIRGKALVTDAPNTAYALQAKKILLKQGLKDGIDYRLNAVGAGPPPEGHARRRRHAAAS